MNQEKMVMGEAPPKKATKSKKGFLISTVCIVILLIIGIIFFKYRSTPSKTQLSEITTKSISKEGFPSISEKPESIEPVEKEKQSLAQLPEKGAGHPSATEGGPPSATKKLEVPKPIEKEKPKLKPIIAQLAETETKPSLPPTATEKILSSSADKSEILELVEEETKIAPSIARPIEKIVEPPPSVEKDPQVTSEAPEIIEAQVLEELQMAKRDKKTYGPLSEIEKETNYYIVQEGDCLWTIARNLDILGDPHKWHLIYSANKAEIKNADLIYPGQKLIIPKKN